MFCGALSLQLDSAAGNISGVTQAGQRACRQHVEGKKKQRRGCVREQREKAAEKVRFVIQSERKEDKCMYYVKRKLSADKLDGHKRDKTKDRCGSRQVGLHCMHINQFVCATWPKPPITTGDSVFV